MPHFMIATHPAEVAGMIRAHLRAANGEGVGHAALG
jgi:hypothetical protein